MGAGKRIIVGAFILLIGAGAVLVAALLMSAIMPKLMLASKSMLYIIEGASASVIAVTAALGIARKMKKQDHEEY